MTNLHARALEYITNTGGSPKLEEFDDDHAPIGAALREELKAAGKIYEFQGRVRLVPADGKALRSQLKR